MYTARGTGSNNSRVEPDQIALMAMEDLDSEPDSEVKKVNIVDVKLFSKKKTISFNAHSRKYCPRTIQEQESVDKLHYQSKF